MCRLVDELLGVTTLPLQIDASDPAVIEAAVRSYPGKALINSVNGKEESLAAVVPLAARYGIENILATRSDKGATLVSRGEASHIPVWPVEVYDVSGAGDTMLAAASAFASAGLPLRDAAVLANAASQIVIGKVGTYPIKAGELLAVVTGGNASAGGKIYSTGEAENLCGRWRANGEKVVFTNGCFDILHAGHVDSLTAAKSLGDRLIVGLNSDASVKRLKGESRPVNGEISRAKVLSALEAVDAVVIFGEDTPAELLSRLRPDVLAKGGDYRPEDVAGRIDQMNERWFEISTMLEELSDGQDA